MIAGHAIPDPGVGQLSSMGGAGVGKLLVVGGACLVVLEAVGGGQLAPVVGLQGGGTSGGFTGRQLTKPAALARQALSYLHWW